MLTKFISIDRYSPEVRTFATLITSTKVFSLIICKTLCQNDPLPRDFRLFTQRFDDYLPRDLTIIYLEIVDSIHKQVRGCLQNLFQSVAIHLKYVLLVLL